MREGPWLLLTGDYADTTFAVSHISHPGAMAMYQPTHADVFRLSTQAARNAAQRMELSAQAADAHDYAQETYLRAIQQLRKRKSPLTDEKHLRGLLSFVARSVIADDLRARLGRSSNSKPTEAEKQERRERKKHHQRKEHEAAALSWPSCPLPDDAPSIRGRFREPRVQLVELSELLSIEAETAEEQRETLGQMLKAIPSDDLRFAAFTLAKGLTMTETAELIGIDRRELTRRRLRLSRHLAKFLPNSEPTADSTCDRGTLPRQSKPILETIK